ncbi:hypothetical protein LOK49_LG09G01924 [Camellia lanceoleosa]|uniref:Uncharacterized protein n=1 Tax=Camellia lanceoleosa TaxID=1840588 RepID=A0ACC0GMG3_9ERIC|nr:hypothetical protein LOK49_LG09G01924 [Camellia lanceoleosa]
MKTSNQIISEFVEGYLMLFGHFDVQWFGFEVSFEDKKEELFEMVNIPAWFAVDTRLGSLFVHLDTPQCFFAEMYSADLNIIGKLEHDKGTLTFNNINGVGQNKLSLSTKRCSFYLHPREGSAIQILMQGKLSAPHILRMHKTCPHNQGRPNS